MSDLFPLREKTEKGKEWRGEITIPDDGDSRTLTVRQLVDTEYWEVMTYIDLEELTSLSESDDVDEDKLEELQDLANQSALSDSETERMQQLESEIDTNLNIFDSVSMETFTGIKKTAKYCVEPDQNDIVQAMNNHAATIEDEYGAATDENAREWVNENVIDPMIEESTDLLSFMIGMKALQATLETEGN